MTRHRAWRAALASGELFQLPQVSPLFTTYQHAGQQVATFSAQASPAAGSTVTPAFYVRAGDTNINVAMFVAGAVMSMSRRQVEPPAYWAADPPTFLPRRPATRHSQRIGTSPLTQVGGNAGRPWRRQCRVSCHGGIHCTRADSC